MNSHPVKPPTAALPPTAAFPPIAKPSAVPTGDTAAEKGKILVIDDTPVNLQLVYAHLRKFNYRVLVAEDGKSGFESAKKMQPDIILLDIMMPGINGFECCEMLKQEASTKDIPVIFMTALIDTAQKVRAFEVGAVDYVTKPVQLPELMARVNTHLQLRRLQMFLTSESRLLQEKNQELERRYKEVTTFSHCISVDLKAPLNAMHGFLKVLAKDLETQGNAQSRHFIRQVMDSRTRMANTIDLLLLLANLHNQQVDMEKLNMTVVLAPVRAKVAENVGPAEIQSPSTWPLAWGYAPWVQIVWEIYLANAIRHGGKSPVVTLGAERLADEGLIKFWIKDNGAGLTPEEQSRLGDGRVDLFMGQDGPDIARVKEGYGLELSVAEQIIENLGGYVGLESAKGKGSLFYFTLPAAE